MSALDNQEFLVNQRLQLLVHVGLRPNHENEASSNQAYQCAEIIVPSFITYDAASWYD